jgi:hypothetical protein
VDRKSTVRRKKFEVWESKGVDRNHGERDSIRGSGISAFRMEAIGRFPVEIARSRGAKFRRIL